MFYICPSRALRSSIGLASFFFFAPHLIHAQTPKPATPKMQISADLQAYNAARKITDPAQRLEADRQVLKVYPTSSRIDSVHMDILQVLIKAFPDRTAEIDEQANYLAEHPGMNMKIFEDAYIAGLLADAGSKGVDLPMAEKLAKAAVKAGSDAPAQASTPAAADVKQPGSSAASRPVPLIFRVKALTALATVYLNEDKVDDAKPVLAEAYVLSPADSDVNLLRGRLALVTHDDAGALEAFERASIMGGIRSPWRETMMTLYRKANGGSDAGFLHDMDVRYAKLFPIPFVPAKHEPQKPGHTVLLEFFTGSGCIPCIGGDLATDVLMNAYSRDEVVELELDQHIPDPDPLANPDTVARAALYGTMGMPTFILDGASLPFQGESREKAGELYAKLAAAVDAQEAESSPVALKLRAERTADSGILAKAEIDIGIMEDLHKYLAKAVVAAPAASASGRQNLERPPASIALSKPPNASKDVSQPNLVVNFALVEDNVRYTGENGVRFHRMVVRALPSRAIPVQLTVSGKSTFEFAFHVGEINAKWATYLDSFENDHDPFRKIEFMSKDTTMDPDQLAVVAWVQDTTTHRVLQTQFVPVALGR